MSSGFRCVLTEDRAQGFPGWAFLTIPQGRGFMATLPALGGPSDFSRNNQGCALSEQPEITARLYLPDSVAPRRTLVYFHGGGFSLGQASDYDGCIRRLAHASGLAVLSVNYRLAPNTKYPAAVEDAYAAVQWMRQNAGSFDLNGDDLVVGGDSAGANLAAVVCLLCRDRQGPAIAKQLLVSPLLDHGVVTESYRLFGRGPGPLTQRDIDWFISHYLNREAELDDPSVSPMRATACRGFRQPSSSLRRSIRCATTRPGMRNGFRPLGSKSRCASSPGCFTVSGSRQGSSRGSRSHRLRCCGAQKLIAWNQELARSEGEAIRRVREANRTGSEAPIYGPCRGGSGPQPPHPRMLLRFRVGLPPPSGAGVAEAGGQSIPNCGSVRGYSCGAVLIRAAVFSLEA